jgi:cysteine sulfinate desulfinase/cysteine desulfurase-like protein
MSGSADPVYLDCNATTPVLPEVVEALLHSWRARASAA